MRRRCGRLERYLSFLLTFVFASLVLIITWKHGHPVFSRQLSFIATSRVTKPTSKPPTAATSKTRKTSDNGSNRCLRVNNIGFLKVHKSGSTTITNILTRFARKNNLNLVLPNKKEGQYGFNYLGHDRNFTTSDVIPIPKGEQYNILCNHVVYNRTVFRRLLPNGTFYFAIVREPEDRFISAAFYYGLVKSLKKKVPGINSTNYVFSTWLKNPWKYGVSMETYNHVAFDFGVQLKYFNNKTYLDKYIQSLDSDFNLVLLMDYFDESLMLLRRKLCWSMKDMIYLKRNRGAYTIKYALSEDDRKLLKKWQMADRTIYEHFKSRFWQEVEAEGQDLFLETSFFKDVLRRVSDYCFYGTSLGPSIDIEPSRWSGVITVTRYDCQDMNMSEESWVLRLQRFARKKYSASLKKTKSAINQI